ncbi:MAG: hypothetical protein GY714_15845 [Desulfobacterales bacterium]|nr:hypothetical protein [Desulfobacterales bacterium]
MTQIYIGSKSGIDPEQLSQRIEIQLRLELELNHPDISFRYIEIQPPGNLNRSLTKEEQYVIDIALDKNFVIGFEFPHLWNGRDIDPCDYKSAGDIITIAGIAKEVGASYIFTNPGDISNHPYDRQRWEKARKAHIDIMQQLSEVHSSVGMENTNPIRHLDGYSVYGYFGMVPEDLFLFDFITLDIAHAQFAVNHFNRNERIESIESLEAIHQRETLSLDDYADILKDKIQVIHAANAIGLGEIDKEGLKLSEGQADCTRFIERVLKNRTTSIHIIAEPSHIPYNIDYFELGTIMYEEEKVLFEICTSYFNNISINQSR